MGLYDYGSRAIHKQKDLQRLFISHIFFLSTAYLLLSFVPLFESAFGSFSFNVLFNTSLLNLHGVLVRVLAIMVFFLTFTVSFNSFNLINSYLQTDFSIVSSLGGTGNYIKDYQSGSFLYFIIYSNLLAVIIAHVVGFISDLTLNFFFKEIPFSLTFYLPNLFILGGAIINIFFSLLIVGKIVSNNLRTDIESLRGNSVNVTTQKTTFSSFFLLTFFKKSKSKISYKLASFNISRLSFDFGMNLFNYALLSVIIFTALIGSIAVNDSADITMKEAIGEHSFAITKKSMEQIITSGYDMSNELNFNPNQLLNNSLFPKQIIENLLSSLHIPTDHLDERIILYQQIRVSFGLYNAGYYSIYVVGYDKNNFISHFRNYAFNNPTTTNNDGSMLAIWNLVQDSSSSTFLLTNYPKHYYQITSLIQDPFMKGNVVYVALNSLISSMGTKYRDSRNVIFLKDLNQSLVQPLRTKLNSLGYSLVDMQNIINKNSGTIRSLGIPLLLSDIPVTLAFLILIQNYSLHIIHKRKSVLNSLKMLGAKSKFITDVIFYEIKGLLFWGSLIGLLVSWVLLFAFFIPNAVISTNLILPFLSFTILLFLVILYQVKRLTTSFYNEFIAS